MAMDFDAVISVGGQSLLDGLWRILQPVLPPLKTPLPFDLPGASNSTFSLEQMLPQLSLSGPGSPQLFIHIELAAATEILLGAQQAIAGLPVTLPLSVPVDVDLSRAGKLLVVKPVTVEVTLSLAVVENPRALNAFGGLLFTLRKPKVAWPLLPNGKTQEELLAKSISTQLTKLLAEISLPIAGVTPTPLIEPDLKPADIKTIAGNLAKAALLNLEQAVKQVLDNLLARTGRLVFPLPSTDDVPATRLKKSCDLELIPHAARARLDVSSKQVVLQVGFATLPDTVIPKIPKWPSFQPTTALEIRVDVSKQFLLQLLCCLIQKLPNFAFHESGDPNFHDPDKQDCSCCRFGDVVLDLWPISCSGWLEICICGPDGAPKTIELVGHFTDGSLGDPQGLMVITVDFTLRLALDLDPRGALTNLRLTEDVQPNVRIEPTYLEGAGGVAAGGSTLPFGGAAVIALVGLVGAAAFQLIEGLKRAVKTLLDRAHLLTSVPAIPGSFFEAFGNLVPVNIELDDLAVTGVLKTPTSPWALKPLQPPTLTHVVPKPPEREPPIM